MAAGLIYRNAALYETVMLLLYGRHYASRYKAIAALIDEGSSVLDLCCGPAALYQRYLRRKQVRYTGLDVSETFIRRLVRGGAAGHVWDVHSDRQLPRADYVVMQASLYHFLPDPGPVVGRMLQAALRQVIIAEPVRNLTDSKLPVVSALCRRLTDPGNGGSADHRFNEQSLSLFFERFAPRIQHVFRVPGGREKVYVLNAVASE